MENQRLPAGFEELESFVDHWDQPTVCARWNARASLSLTEIQTFYDAVLSRAEDAMSLVERYPLACLPTDIASLFRLVLALPHAAMAVEIHHAPRAPFTPFPHTIELIRGPDLFS